MELMEWIEIIYGVKLFLVSWVLSGWASTLVTEIDVKKDSSPFVRLMYVLPLYVLSCEKCFTFWLVLIITQNFFWAAGLSFLMMIVSRLNQNIPTKLN